MATAAVSRGYAHWILGSTAYNNAPGSSYEGNWTFNIGQAMMNWYGDNQHCAGCVAYTIPSLTEDTSKARTISIPASFCWMAGSCQILAVLSTTAPVNLEYRYGPTSGIISNEIGAQILSGDYPVTFNFTINEGVSISGKTVYLYLYGNTAYNSSNGNYVVSLSFSDATITYTEGGRVYIDNGSGFEAYVPYIDNGSGWDMVIPYVDNGTSFEMCSG